MTNKVDGRRLDRPPVDEPSPTNTLACQPNSEGGRNAEPAAADKPDVPAGDDGPPRRRPLKSKTDATMKDPKADLQARQDVIGAGLKRLYDEVVEEPIPPEFLELLDQIDRKRDQ